MRRFYIPIRTGGGNVFIHSIQPTGRQLNQRFSCHTPVNLRCISISRAPYTSCRFFHSYSKVTACDIWQDTGSDSQSNITNDYFYKYNSFLRMNRRHIFVRLTQIPGSCTFIKHALPTATTSSKGVSVLVISN